VQPLCVSHPARARATWCEYICALLCKCTYIILPNTCGAHLGIGLLNKRRPQLSHMSTAACKQRSTCASGLSARAQPALCSCFAATQRAPGAFIAACAWEGMPTAKGAHGSSWELDPDIVMMPCWGTDASVRGMWILVCWLGARTSVRVGCTSCSTQHEEIWAKIPLTGLGTPNAHTKRSRRIISRQARLYSYLTVVSLYIGQFAVRFVKKLLE